MRDDPRKYLNDFPESKNRQNNHAEKQWHKTTQVYVEHSSLSSSERSVALGLLPSIRSAAVRIAARSSSVICTQP
jgi:hypothetical protein